MNSSPIKLKRRSQSSFVSIQTIVFSRVLSGVFHRLDELEHKNSVLSQELKMLRQRKEFMFETSG